MRLSEAIRLGATLKPQGYVDLIRAGRTCAAGAALDAIGQLRREQEQGEGWTALQEAFPILRSDVKIPHTCVLEQPAAMELRSLIWHLNDQHRLSREAIADEVEGWERILSGADEEDDSEDDDFPTLPSPEPLPVAALQGER